MREGNIFSLSTLAGLGGGVGVPRPRSGWGGVPHPRSKWGLLHPADGGYPIQDQDLGLNPGYPSSKTGRGTLLSKTGWGTLPPLLQDRIGYCLAPPLPSGDRSAKRALATWRALCLLRSRRRTSLLEYLQLHIHIYMKT